MLGIGLGSRFGVKGSPGPADSARDGPPSSILTFPVGVAVRGRRARNTSHAPEEGQINERIDNGRFLFSSLVSRRRDFQGGRFYGRTPEFPNFWGVCDLYIEGAAKRPKFGAVERGGSKSGRTAGRTAAPNSARLGP